MVVYQCEDSLEGIFTAIYNAYEDRREHGDTRISLNGELFLFAEYVPVASDERKACKVMKTLRSRFGDEDYLKICFALASCDPEKAQAVYQTVVLGLSRRCAQGHLFDNLANDWVHHVFTLARNVGNEKHHLVEFVRFKELENGILFSKIGPKNNVVTFLMPHFSDRFPLENFMIFDENRELFGVHPAGKQWYLMQGSIPEAGAEGWKLSGREQEYQELFRYFCHKIAIKERENKELQRNMLPLRFQEYMIEFE